MKNDCESSEITLFGSKGFRLFLILVTVAGCFLAIIVTYRAPKLALIKRDDGMAVGQWEYLSDRPWQYARTAWLAAANESQPSLDQAFPGGPISIGGQAYEKGIGIYPLSEIIYRLDGEYIAFESDVGIDDSVPAERGGVIFQIYLDDVMVYSTGALKSGEPPVQIRLSIGGITTMRLVAIDATDGTVRNYADWADARILKRLAIWPAMRRSPVFTAVQERNKSKKNDLEKDNKELAALAKKEIGEFRKGFGRQDAENGISVTFDRDRHLLQLSNSKLGIELGYGGSWHGYLTALDLEDGRLVLNNAYSSVSTDGTNAIRLPMDTIPGNNGFRFEDVVDPVFGPGKRLEADFKAKDDPITIVVYITIFPESRYLFYSLSLENVVFLEERAPTFYFFEAANNNLVIGEDAQYLTDFSQLRRSCACDDGILRTEKVGQGKPVFVWSERLSRGLLLAALDETRDSPSFSIAREQGRITARLGYRTSAVKETLSSPRLFLEITTTGDTRSAFNNFQHIFSNLYPQLPLPSWLRYQWLSWYPFAMEISDESLRKQIDYIADNLADLGPWHIIIDAGWYVTEGRPDAEWRNVDRDKFPQGIRSLVNYAHSRGIKVILYISTPYLDSREQPGDWLGLKGIINNHRDWLLPIGVGNGRESFVYDYSNPELRDYMKAVLRDFFVGYDVDGMKVDGLGNAGGALLDPSRIDAFGLVDRVVGPTMDIYRFNHETASSLKDDIYIESGWLTPLFANQYAHTFRFGDELDEFSSPYPFPGLVEHIDYAQVQKMILGQRSNMGALRGDPNVSQVNRWMLEAGLALGTQAVLSFYLPAMDDGSLSFYRSLLYHYNAFDGETYFGSTLYSDTFATTVKGTTYLGVLNRDKEDKRLRLRLSDYGMAASRPYTAYSVEANTYLRVQDTMDVLLTPESFTLFILRAEAGVMWTNSSVEYSETESEIILKVRGPHTLPGFVQLMVPRYAAVLLDGRQMRRQTRAGNASDVYHYDQKSRIVTVRYDQETEHEIRIAVP